MMHHRLGALTVLAISLLLVGCGSLIDLDAIRPDTRLFTLRPNIEAPPGSTIDQTLLIEQPVASGAIDGMRLAVMVSPTEISYVSGASWESRPAELFHGLMVEAFEGSGRLAGITTTGSNLGGGFRLETELRDFHVTFRAGNQASVEVRLKAALFAAGERFQDIEQSFSSNRAIPSRDLDAIIEAFNSASGEVIEGLVDWTMRHVGK